MSLLTHIFILASPAGIPSELESPEYAIHGRAVRESGRVGGQD